MRLTSRLFQSVLLLIFISVFTVSCAQTPIYTILFHTSTDAIITPIEGEPGSPIQAPSNPTREGYRFEGWFLNGEIFQFDVMPSQNIELSAKWSQYFNIVFDSAGGSMIPSIQVAEGDPISMPEDPSYLRHRFLGWTYEGEPWVASTMPSHDLPLVATWAATATISFEAAVFDRHLDEFVQIPIAILEDIVGAPIASPAAPQYPEYQFVSWQINGVDYDFSEMPENDITLVAQWIPLSNLPAFFIDMFDWLNNPVEIEQVNREDYVRSTISLVNTATEFQMDEIEAFFKGRGNGSWIDAGDKKGYRIKFVEKQAVFGNPESKHWVLLACANFDDITMYRNKLAYNMADEIFTNLEYVTTAQWVDVYFNGEYHGVYLLAEQIRVDDDRVDIESEYGMLDTGYLIEYDAYATGVQGVDYFRVSGLKYPFTMKSPDPAEYLENGYDIEQYKEQVRYIQALVKTMVDAALSKDFATFEQSADVNSFVDMYILHELFKNIDTGYSSFYIYRNPGGKLFAGPPWDFDATCGSSPNRGNGSPNGIYVGLSVQAFSSRTANELLINLYATPAFKELVKNRWNVIAPSIQDFIMQTLSDDMVETYRYAMGRNFVRWPSPFGYGTVLSQELSESNWDSNIGILKKWMLDRITWLNNEWKLT
jgi:uncharacterized repeat protein (TIGR02543 family)